MQLEVREENGILQRLIAMHPDVKEILQRLIAMHPDVKGILQRLIAMHSDVIKALHCCWVVSSVSINVQK